MLLDQAGKQWYKGNLHTHTTRSDGRKTPEEAIALYRDSGYDFLALTDHWVCSQTAQAGSLLLLSGCEYNTGPDPVSGIYHIVGIGMQTDPGLDRTADWTPQAIIDAIKDAGGLAILAHPAWSLNTTQHILPLSGLDGTEIYNSVSDLPHNARPDSSLIVDQLASVGRYLPCIASDDSHFYDGEETKSFIRVQSKSCSAPDILAAIRAGDFYASQGPRLNLWQTGDRIEIRCSPASAIVCYSDAVWSGNRVFTGPEITRASYPIGPEDHFIRVEIIDAAGRHAWTSPYRLS